MRPFLSSEGTGQETECILYNNNIMLPYIIIGNVYQIDKDFTNDRQQQFACIYK